MIFGKRMDFKATLCFYGVMPEEINECILWAFGEGAGTCPTKDLPYRWNLRHKSIFFAYEGMNQVEFVKRVAEAWTENKDVYRSG